MEHSDNFYYVYILQSLSVPNARYTGLTENLQLRLDKHNSGAVPHTSKLRPWKIETTIAFSKRSKALAFERYLKSGSGRAFAKKHF
ncbi:MAG: GIY-YIG nuclease family protein [Verrucomicrobia bacterium]|nr:GIY-YIG nuclease family protein [Verrucomicrobiota bacterium]MCF7708149.1 GIY-YIG nuclease family protein [Verrucomicrobiota bacterium]